MSSGADLPPPYYALKDDDSKEQNATEVPIPESHSDAPQIYNVLFEDKDCRIGFTQKILVIKLMQAFAVILVTLILDISPYRLTDYYTRVNFAVVASLILVTTLGLIHYCDKARFVTPYNYIFLVAYPLAVGFFVSVVLYRCGLYQLFLSWVHFNVVLFALLVYSIMVLQNKIEFKTKNALFITGGTLLVLYVLTVALIYGVNPFGIFYCSLMMFALTAYILTDLQAMMSKTYRIHICPSDVVKAALIMHIDYRYMLMKIYNKLYQKVASQYQ